MSPYTLKRQHRLIGIVLLLPFLAWSLTGVFFLVRPGYDEAYERVPVWQYPLPANLSLQTQADWREVRHFRSILGEHVIVRNETNWIHLNAATMEEWSLPEEADLQLLLEDAFQFNADRYGQILSVSGNEATTTTGIELSVSWPTLSITQFGRDRRWIDQIYSIHYLEWTGFFWTDRLLGLLGLGLLMYMTFTGWMMAFGPNQKFTSGETQRRTSDDQS